MGVGRRAAVKEKGGGELRKSVSVTPNSQLPNCECFLKSQRRLKEEHSLPFAKENFKPGLLPGEAWCEAGRAQGLHDHRNKAWVSQSGLCSFRWHPDPRVTHTGKAKRLLNSQVQLPSRIPGKQLATRCLTAASLPSYEPDP